MRALIDGDILVYRVGYASQEIEVGYACSRMDFLVDTIVASTQSVEACVYLSSTDRSNFRYHLYPEYKAGRTQPKPIWYAELREHLLSERHGGILVSGREADDALADDQTKDTVICSIDKDLDQVAGKHYDFVKKTSYDISPERGIRFFYHQLLTGDPTDNIPGIKGIGPIKAAQLLATTDGTEQGMFKAVRGKYTEVYKDRADELMLLNGRLLKIGGDIWQPEELVNTARDSKPSLDDMLNGKDSSTNPVE